MNAHVGMLCAAALIGLTTLPLDVNAVSVSSLQSEIHRDEVSAADFDSKIVRIPRQEDDERPRILYTILKIVRGVMSGNIHDIFHGTFSFAPSEVSDNMIRVYNQVMGVRRRPPSNNETSAEFEDGGDN